MMLGIGLENVSKDFFYEILVGNKSSKFWVPLNMVYYWETIYERNEGKYKVKSNWKKDTIHSSGYKV